MNKVNLMEQNQWEAGPDEELRIPEAYISELRYEINVFTPKKIFSFRCRSYEPLGVKKLWPSQLGAWSFQGVIIDSSKRDAQGEVTLKRITYHPEIELVNVSFMVIPAIEASPSDADS